MQNWLRQAKKTKKNLYQREERVISLKKPCRLSVLCQPSRLCGLSVVWPAGGYSQDGAVDSRAITVSSMVSMTRYLGQKQRQTYKYKYKLTAARRSYNYHTRSERILIGTKRQDFL